MTGVKSQNLGDEDRRIRSSRLVSIASQVLGGLVLRGSASHRYKTKTKTRAWREVAE